MHKAGGVRRDIEKEDVPYILTRLDEFLKQFRLAREAHGYQNVDEYLKDIGFDPVKIHEELLKKSSIKPATISG